MPYVYSQITYPYFVISAFNLNIQRYHILSRFTLLLYTSEFALQNENYATVTTINLYLLYIIYNILYIVYYSI